MSTADAATGLTISGALESLNRDVEIRQARLVKELGGKEEFRSFLAPDTLTQAITDAQAAQQALAELGGGKKRKLVDEAEEAAKKWALPPGESLVNPEVAPFLAYNEEYFRHITPEDVANLVPEGARRVEDDPDFRIPALGRYYALGEFEPDLRVVTPLDLRRDRCSLRLPSLPRRPLSSHRLFPRFFLFFCSVVVVSKTHKSELSRYSTPRRPPQTTNSLPPHKRTNRRIDTRVESVVRIASNRALSFLVLTYLSEY